MQVISDTLSSLRALLESNQADTNRLRIQVNNLLQRQGAIANDPTEILPIVSDPIETEVEKLRRENAELIERILVNRTTPIAEERPHNRIPKVGDPSLFHGKKEELPGFLAGLGVIFTLQASLFRSDRDRIMYAFTFIRGPPRNALTPAIIDQRIWDVTNWTRSYTTFTDHLKKNYGDPNERQTAIDKINSLRQMESACQFFASFTEYSSTLDWPDEVLVANGPKGTQQRIIGLPRPRPERVFNGFRQLQGAMHQDSG